MIRSIFILFALLFTCCDSYGSEFNYCAKPDTLEISSDSLDLAIEMSKDSIPISELRKRKRIAAILAFPLPFGLLGLHRLHLGTKPYIPFVYAGTLGGCLGIIPMIDFITILTTPPRKLNSLEDHPGVFMWIR